MHVPGLPSIVFLVYVLLLMPWMALRSKQRLLPRPDPEGAPARPVPSRPQVFASTLVALALLFALSWITARDIGFDPFAVHAVGAREMLAGAAVLAFHFMVMLANRAVRSREERRTMAVYKLMPRTPAEWALYVVTALTASVAEEAGYRGVLMSVLWFSFGNGWLAAIICATAFAASHALQGWKSGVAIFAMALSMHGLVWFTGTLVVAMVVHAVYDIAAGAIGARRVRLAQVEG